MQSKYFGGFSFYKKTFLLAFPLLLQQLISNSVTLIINLMIGGLGDASLAGVAAVNRFFMIATYGTNGAIAASSVFIAQFYGANNQTRMKQAFRFALLVSSGVMIAVIVPMVIFPRHIINFIVSDGAVVQEGLKYVTIAALSFIPNMIALPIIAAMRATGDTKTPLHAAILSFISNIFFNVMLIYGNFGFPQLGIVGGAISLLIARSLELGFLSYALKFGTYSFKFAIKTLFEIPKDLINSMLRKIIPLTANEILWAIGLAILLKFYASRGADVLSGYSIASTVSDLFFTMNAGMAVCCTILVAQPLGANKLDLAKQNGYHILGFAVLMSLFFASMMFSSSFFVPYLYTVSAESTQIAVSFLRIMSGFFIIYILNNTCYCILRAGGDMISTMILDSGHMWGVNLIAVGLAANFTTLPIIPLYIIGQSTDIVKLAIAFYLVRREKWVTSLAMHHSLNDAFLDELPSL